MTNRTPTRAELNDVMNTLIDGANGLVLAAETAIGNHIVDTVDALATLIERFCLSLDGARIDDLLTITLPLLLGSPPKNVQFPRKTSANKTWINHSVRIQTAH